MASVSYTHLDVYKRQGQYYCMTATEAGLYDQMSGGNLRKTMTSLTHKNLPPVSYTHLTKSKDSVSSSAKT